jgi:spore coat protein A, manganese oxidase
VALLCPELFLKKQGDFGLSTRREFLWRSILGAASVAGSHLKIYAETSQVESLDLNRLARFVDPLPILEIARPVGQHALPEAPHMQRPLYRLALRQIMTKLHRDLPPTRVWTVGDQFPGSTIETRSGEGIFVEWKNELPLKHFLPIDHTLHGAERDKPEVRSVVHLHGGRTPADCDGYPEDWYLPGQSRTYYYPNQQDSALLWYHDHAMGINRLNIYAGLMGLYVIRDEAEDALNLPRGRYEVPLVIFDRDLRSDGQLNYPVSPDPERPWVPEVFGEAQLVNGKLYPYLDVEPRKYRFRILNGANGRFYRLSLPDGVFVYQIGTDQGLLSAPVPVRHVQLAPAERADLIVDFSPHRGERIVLSSDSFPLMQFRVAKESVQDTSSLPAILRPLERIPEAAAILTRRLTLNEDNNPVGESMGMLLNDTPWHMPITEKPVLGSTEIWEFVNLTEDVHPIHLHMVRFQILDRRRFDVFQYMNAGGLRYTSEVLQPEANELGWKDTVRANSGTVTRILVPFHGYAGRYVWHCHLLEHEDNEMMRPYEILPARG